MHKTVFNRNEKYFWKMMMGFLDFLLTTNQKKEKIATQIGLDSGLFEMCPVCHDVTESRQAAAHRQETEDLIEQLIARNDPSIALFQGNQTELSNTVAKVAKKLPFNCTCENI